MKRDGTIGRKVFGGWQVASAAVLLMAVTALGGCGGAKKEPEPNVTVQVTPAKRGDIELTVTAEAVVYPLQQAVIMPKVSSTIRKFHVQRGSHVKQGQLLVELENADLSGAEEQTKGEYDEAQATYETITGASLPQQIQKAELDAAAAKVGLEAQQKVYDSRKNLFEQGALPRRELDAADVALAQARSQSDQAQKQLADLQRLVKQQTLKSASGQLSAAKGKYLNAKALLSYSEIRSPINGAVTDRPMYEGELAGGTQPIMTIMNSSKLIAKAHIVQNEAVLLKVGDEAELKIPGLDEPVKGKVMLISPALDPGSTTIEVWVEAIKPGSALKPGMNISIDATAKKVEDALIVPAAAVLKSAEGADYVMTAGSDGKAHQTAVKVGIRNKDEAEIQSGLKENDRVITAGGYGLPDNTKITIEASPAPASEGEKGADDKGGKPDAAPAKEKE